jgi:transcriptional regulator with XRE-family HTH domain
MASGYYNPVCVEKRSFAVVCPSTFFVGNRQYEPGYKPLMISAAQSRAARGLVEWSQEQLAVESHLGLSTIRDFEKGRRAPTHNNLLGIKMALESAGVVFVAAGPEGGAGVRLGKTPGNAADLTRRIDTIEDDLARSEGPSVRTPAGGMRTLERAHKREAVKKLKNRRTKLKPHK